MGFPSTLKDAQGIPISSVYIPGVGWAALQGSQNSNTDANGTSAPALMSVWQMVQDQIMQGHGFSATTGLVTTGATSAYVGLQAIVNNIAKNVLLYNILVATGSGAALTDIQLHQNNATTADAALSSSLLTSIKNQQPASATTSLLSALWASPASTTQTGSFVGTQVSQGAATANTVHSPLQNGSLYWFAKGDVGSVALYAKVPTSGNSAGITFQWIEFS